MIANHVASKLSALDLQIARHVRPGGNWKDVPLDVPSARIAQIRLSAAAGEGSRSTYYGRLADDAPSYTINTYYSRPGNGCHLHYGQERTLSHREAARFQSFPDSFEFVGSSQRAISQQIGNAVPPLLAYQLALGLGDAGEMIDVFAGAGGLSLGFKWAGWRSLAATDFEPSAVATFNKNVEPVAFVGDMTSEDTLARLEAAAARRSGRLALVGGPPCQGFSTGGKRRSLDDQRNWLFRSYVALIARIAPDLIVFENVLGLLSMDGGSFVRRVMDEIREVGYDVRLERVNAADYGVPQRRNRVIILGVPRGKFLPHIAQAWSANYRTSAREAISDLPELNAGQDGARLPYLTEPESSYQELMRGRTTPRIYIQGQLQHANDTDRQLRHLQLGLGFS